MGFLQMVRGMSRAGEALAVNGLPLKSPVVGTAYDNQITTRLVRNIAKISKFAIPILQP